MTGASDEWRAEDVALVFLTCPREPAYFATTLASALLGDALAGRLREIAVAVDAPDLECVASLSHHTQVRWVPRTAEETARVQGFHVHRRACHNYWRALGLGAEARGLIVCEDDVIFRDGWLGMLLECLNEMNGAEHREFILAAYSPYDHEARWLRRGRCFSSYIANGFYGTQAVFYPRGEAETVRSLIWTHGVVVSEAPYDLLIQRRAVARQHLYATRCSLAQHIGAKSTGLGDGRHRSPSFATPWPVATKTGGMTPRGKVRVLTSISYDVSLLPHFVSYYRSLGVEEFAISVLEQRPGIRAEAEALAATLGAGIHLYGAAEWEKRRGVEGANKDELRRRVAQPGDWLIPADLDEFIQFPAPLPALIDELRGADAQYVTGTFRDRLAPDGVLTATEPAPAIWEQYPLEAAVTERLAQGLCTKVILCREDCELSSGHHFVCGAMQAWNGARGTVHHFKWRAGLVEALQRRVAVYQREKVPWVGECERVVAYLAEHGRIVPEQFAARHGWQPPIVV